MLTLPFVSWPTAGRADEGMWLFSDPPETLLEEEHAFKLDPEWLDHLRLSSVRFNNGGSGSFVSPDGLVMTNHHVALGSLQKLSTKETDYVKKGFYAPRPEDEIRCVDLELNVLVAIEDATSQINTAVPSGTVAEEATRIRRAAMNEIENESFKKTGLRSDVVTLYHGGQYHLYRFKRYTDVRLVFAPEHEIAFFGGDPDNFEYPRYDLDVTFFRVYEDDKPARQQHYLRWSKAGAARGELVFVSGHPGHTDRMNTVAHLEFLRDVSLPAQLNEIRRREVLLTIFSDRSPENARRAQRDLFGYRNSRKARLGALAGLQDPEVIRRKQAEETSLQEAIGANAELRTSCDEAWNDIARSMDVWSEIYIEHHLLDRGAAFNSTLFHKARALVRMAEDNEKPNGERLREYRESALPSLEQQLFSEAPIYKDLETTKLTDSLGMYMEMAGADDPLVLAVMAGVSPSARADQLVRNTTLEDVDTRKKLAEGGRQALDASDDPMIALARLVDDRARAIRKTFEEKVDEPLRQAYARIATARFAVAGKGVYPDATFTLRLAFGTVEGYEEFGRSVPPWTTIGGAFRYADQQGNTPPFKLPELWHQRKGAIDLSTPLNFVSKVDIIGGNSGSPVVNRRAEVVGLIFDGNSHSLVWGFAYNDQLGRAVSVHSSGIVEALRNVYQATALVEELGR